MISWLELKVCLVWNKRNLLNLTQKKSNREQKKERFFKLIEQRAIDS